MNSHSSPPEQGDTYFIEPLESDELYSEKLKNEVKKKVLIALAKKFPDRFFQSSIKLENLTLTQIIQNSRSLKCRFENLHLGKEKVHQIEGASVRFFETNDEQVACTLNFLNYNAENDSHQGDIINLLLGKDEKENYVISHFDFLVESKFFNDSL